MNENYNEIEVMNTLIEVLFKDEKDPEAKKAAFLEGVAKDMNNRPVAFELKLEVSSDNAKGKQKTVVVPTNMRLNALHYAIMKAFGLKEDLPHRFAPCKEDFLKLTDGKLTEWARLCGIYFRFPTAASFDLDEDNKADGVDFDEWLRSKYCGPYKTKGMSEFYPVAQLAFEDFCHKNPKLNLKNRKVDEWSSMFGGACDGLIEGGQVDQMFLTPECAFDWKEWAKNMASILEKAEANRKEMLASFLQRIQKFANIADLDVNDAAANEEAGILAVDAELATPKAMPVFRSMKYRYGSGEGLELTISCSNAWHQQVTLKRDANGKLVWDSKEGLVIENTIYLDELENEVTGEFSELLRKVHEDNEPAFIGC